MSAGACYVFQAKLLSSWPVSINDPFFHFLRRLSNDCQFGLDKPATSLSAAIHLRCYLDGNLVKLIGLVDSGITTCIQRSKRSSLDIGLGPKYIPLNVNALLTM